MTTDTTPTPVQVDQLIDMFSVMRDKSVGHISTARAMNRPTTTALMNEWSHQFGTLDKMLASKEPALFTMREKHAIGGVFVALLALTGAIGLRLADVGVIDPGDVK